MQLKLFLQWSAETTEMCFSTVLICFTTLYISNYYIIFCSLLLSLKNKIKTFENIFIAFTVNL
jgi:hypothetical protein